jgi:hypothetical protein
MSSISHPENWSPYTRDLKPLPNASFHNRLLCFALICIQQRLEKDWMYQLVPNQSTPSLFNKYTNINPITIYHREYDTSLDLSEMGVRDFLLEVGLKPEILPAGATCELEIRISKEITGERPKRCCNYKVRQISFMSRSH